MHATDQTPFAVTIFRFSFHFTQGNRSQSQQWYPLSPLSSHLGTHSRADVQLVGVEFSLNSGGLHLVEQDVVQIWVALARGIGGVRKPILISMAGSRTAAMGKK